MSYNRPVFNVPDGFQREPIPPPYAETDPLGSNSPSPPQLPRRPVQNSASNSYESREFVPPLPARPPRLPPRPPTQNQARETAEPNYNPFTNSFQTVTNQLMSTNISATNIFASPISTDAPLAAFTKVNHEVSLPSGTNNSGKPTETNKFYGNIMLGGGTNPIWTHPYSVWYSTDSYYGLALNQTTASQRVFDTTKTPPQFFFGPTGIKSLVYSSTDFNSASDMSLAFYNIKQLSVQVQLKKSDTQFIVFPLVQGMGFVTAIYYNLIPRLFSAVGFKSITGDTSPRSGISKYKILLENNVTWTLYVTIPTGQSLSLALSNGNTIVGDKSVNGCIFQIIADSNTNIDNAAGCYANSCTLEGAVDGANGTYQLKYGTQGTSNSGLPLVYALPHHYQNFDSSMGSKAVVSTLDTTTKGKAQGYLTNELAMKVAVPSTLQYDPFTTISNKSGPNYSDAVLNAITAAATSDVTGDVSAESNLDSMYFSGKVLAKYAWVLYVCQYIIKNSSLVATILPKLKAALGRFISNSQVLPLRYDQTWFGIISSGDSSQDFGNSYYNDHHFHYSYHVITAAIIAKVDKDTGDGSWYNDNKAWVENLVRDYANPSESDPYFPVFRSFDWFNGHSWAKGLFESGDGKDQESSSEDVNAAYALKLWGLASSNSNLENIGNLMLGVLKTSLNNYFLYLDNNTTQPSQYIPNKVSGILFENKIDHTTYFGTNLEYIQMIHAIPVTSASSFVRSPTFVKQEWDELLAPIVGNVTDGWRGILMLNVALYDPTTSYNFFNSSSFQNAYLDGGQSKTWSLTYSGAFL
ncbi:unnamed protein product [Kluyveromyces dobzhanskii CBS 2104]|uniref:glucan endo-1,3-beta-D-glucosidase n=1 Tax=Kluyveromyces dobzhanskii CBS 2104 TaxID=1427455 RepID=A0A0A8L797_9SACH|nr:unnamed protein product [Kluyveromyces dobzhanskii CBS 2104]